MLSVECRFDGRREQVGEVWSSITDSDGRFFEKLFRVGVNIIDIRIIRQKRRQLLFFFIFVFLIFG